MNDIPLKSYLFRGESNLEQMRTLVQGLPQHSTIVDFEENMMLQSVRARTRLWEENGRLIAFSFVDDFNNLRFEVKDGRLSDQLEKEIVAWGNQLVREANEQTGQSNTLDTSFLAENQWQIALLERNGFVRQAYRTLRLARSLTEPIPSVPFPPGFYWRPIKGEAEIEQLVALHRAAFGTQKMTVERRLAIMNGPGYERPLDLVAVGPNSDLVAFCICEVDPADQTLGYVDPIGTHPDYQRLGLAQALVTAGMILLKDRGVLTAEFGTSSENKGMQKLGVSLGFKSISEKVWFTKEVG